MLKIISFFILVFHLNFGIANEIKSNNKEVATRVSFVKEKGKYFATNVTINGVTIPGKFLIDTGSETIISDKAAILAGLEFKKNVTISDGYNFKAVLKANAELNIDGFSFKRTKISVLYEVDFGLGVFCDVAGIIGNDIMKQCVWSFTKNEILICSDFEILKNISSFNKEKLILQGKNRTVPYVVVSFGTPRATALLDTGDDCFVQINKVVLDYIKPQEIIQGKGRAVSMLLSQQNATSKSSYSIIRTDKFTLGDKTVSNPVAYIEADEEGWAIGTGLFDYFDIIIDFPKKNFFLKQTKTEYVSGKWNTFGLSAIIENGNVLVKFVWDDTPAYEADIESNNKIISIDDLYLEDIDKQSSCQIYKKLDDKLSKDSIFLTIEKKDGKRYSYKLQKTNMFK
ncbi:aspartyl protease family protein [Labilibaculum manganireducens]|uniref:aspartyl protease family protein n=1 Tax=Labilibaculum manganireducens TaxID=1940525 RepID=UPI0029F59961|nr:aspartyl protease family protein [Labilibaculum manganireducens]